ncbi:GNAT family N-acetyltransferase [bacterium]|nr:GNAT family N-acetyltransferase [bacterium]
MKATLEDTSLAHFPHAFLNKAGDAIVIKLLTPKRHQKLIDMYLAYDPRASFSGLPPIRDAACVRWVEGMIERGRNLVALSFNRGVVGHGGLFPVNDETAELLLVISPDHQGMGIGTQLARCAVQLAHELGFERVWFETESRNRIAQHVCRKCGFEYLGSSDSGELEMGLDLRDYHAAPRTEDTPVSQILHREVVTVGEDTPCVDAARLLLDHGIATLPVVDEEGSLVGILSEGDLLVEAHLGKTVGHVRTREVVAVHEDCTVAEVVRLLQSKRLRCIPVLDRHGRVVGVLGRRDVLALFVEGANPARE